MWAFCPWCHRPTNKPWIHPPMGFPQILVVHCTETAVLSKDIHIILIILTSNASLMNCIHKLFPLHYNSHDYHYDEGKQSLLNW